MRILAAQPGFNLFSSPPSRPCINDPVTRKTPPPPIPIPKYQTLTTRTKTKPISSPEENQYKTKPISSQEESQSPNRALKSVHRRTKYYKPVSKGVISTEGDRSVVIGESGVSYLLPGAPFEFQFSYSETPKVKPLAIREPAHLPFAPPSMPRPWTGKAPLKKSKKKIPLFDSFNSLPQGTEGVKRLEMPCPFPLVRFPKEERTREEILGEPLTKAEIKLLVKPCLSHNRQVNLGRDGLTHNMLELVHSHWRRQRVCKVRCLGVPTVDMDNVCHHLEDKTGGKIIHRAGGVVYLFRGRNYDYRTRPQYPIMLWKPAAPVYPKLIQDAPEGLTKLEAEDLRRKGQKLLPICKLAKNGVYVNLVKDVRAAFEGSPLVKINCQGLDASDYKRIGAKLKNLVPCVLLSFDGEQILMWRGKDWKSMYQEWEAPSVSGGHQSGVGISSTLDDSAMDAVVMPAAKAKTGSRRLVLLWEKAIESGEAMLLDETDLGPDALLEIVEEFVSLSHPAPISETEQTEDGIGVDDSGDDEEDSDDDGGVFEETADPIPFGLLPVDSLANRLSSE